MSLLDLPSILGLITQQIAANLRKCRPIVSKRVRKFTSERVHSKYVRIVMELLFVSFTFNIAEEDRDVFK